MAMGRRTPKQDEMFIPTAQVATGPGHPFYTKLNAVLAEAAFDEFVEKLCAPHYKEGGRPSIPPGVYFRMLFMAALASSVVASMATALPRKSPFFSRRLSTNTKT